MKKKVFFVLEKDYFYYIRDFFLLFCTVFSFYVISSVQSSMFVAACCALFVFSSAKRTHDFLCLFGTKSGIISIVGLLLILFNSLFFPIAHGTYDLSYIKNYISLIVKFLGIFFIVEIIAPKDGEKPMIYYERLFVHIYVLQSLLQVIAFLFPVVANFFLYFNHAYELYEEAENMRGVALSGGTGWPLGLSYGLAFIFYTKIYIIECKRIQMVKTVVIGVLILVGVFFSGRSAYAGALVSIVYFLFSDQKSWIKKIQIIFRFLIILSLFILLFIFIFTDFVVLLYEKVFPWAFEFFFAVSEGKGLSTGSTNDLMGMWNRGVENLNVINFFIGDGYFTDPVTGKYFHRVDVGYLRNIFFGGLIGSFVLYLYQILIFLPIFLSRNKKQKIFIFWILFYLFLLELKAMAVGFNHMTMTICYSYVLLNHRCKKIQNLRGIVIMQKNNHYALE